MKHTIVLIESVLLVASLFGQNNNISNNVKLASSIPEQPCATHIINYLYAINLCDNNPWVLVFEDNFEGSDLDPNIWIKIEGVNRDENFEGEKSYKLPQNVILSNGKLKIFTKHEQLNNITYSVWLPESGTIWFTNSFDFTTGEVWTKKKFGIGCKIEALIKIPKGKGFWPAFWLFAGSPVYQEIDIFEFMNNNFSDLKSTLHDDWNADGIRTFCLNTHAGIDYSLAFHKYSLVWEDNKIQFLVDDQLIWQQYRLYTNNILRNPVDCQVLPGSYKHNNNFPDNLMQIIFDNVCESQEDLKPDITTPFPGIFEVEWIKCYERSPCVDVNINYQLGLSSIRWNSIVGENIALSNMTIWGDNQLFVVGGNGITLGSDFAVATGASFEARIDASANK